MHEPHSGWVRRGRVLTQRSTAGRNIRSQFRQGALSDDRRVLAFNRCYRRKTRMLWIWWQDPGYVTTATLGRVAFNWYQNSPQELGVF